MVLEKTVQVIFVLQTYFSPIHGETEAGFAQLFSLLFLQPLSGPCKASQSLGSKWRHPLYTQKVRWGQVLLLPN